MQLIRRHPLREPSRRTVITPVQLHSRRKADWPHMKPRSVHRGAIAGFEISRRNRHCLAGTIGKINRDDTRKEFLRHHLPVAPNPSTEWEIGLHRCPRPGTRLRREDS